MSASRTKNATRTFAFGAIGKVVAIIFPFIIRTIIIKKLGNEYAGITSLFTSVLTILNIAELGIHSAIGFCLYKPVAQNDTDAINALMGLLRKLYLIIGCIMLGAGLIVLPFLEHLIAGTPPAGMNIYILYLIYLANVVVSYFGSAYKQTLFEVHQRGDLNHKIMLVTEIGKYVLQILVLVVFVDYYYYALLLPIATIVVNILTHVVSRKQYPHIVPRGKVPAQTKRVIKNKVMFLSVNSISASVTNSMSGIIISGVLGLAANGLYGNYTYIYTAIISILVIAYRAILPGVGNSLQTDSIGKIGELYNTIGFLTFWTATWCSACLLSLYQPFVTVWVGEENLLSMAVVVLSVLFFYVNALKLSLSNIYIPSAGLWNKTMLRQILTTVATLGLTVLLVGRFEFEGVAFASFFPIAVIGLPLDIQVVYKYVLKQNPLKGIITMLFQFIVSVGICAATYYANSFIPLDGILGLLVRGCVCVVLPNILMVILFFRKREFAAVVNKARALIFRRR